MQLRRWSAIAISLGLTVHALAAERTRPTPAAPSFEVTARVVEVSVIATDKHGRPVTDLTASDFVIKDRGRVQTIAHCRSTESVAPGSEKAELERQGVYFNRVPGAVGTPPGVTVILFDQLNSVWPEQVFARRQLLGYLRRLDPHDHVALYTLDQELRLVHDFTQDRQRLIQAADPLRPQLLLDQERDDDDDVLARKIQRERRAQISSAAIIAIANHVAHIPGRKNLVWLASTMPYHTDFGIFSSEHVGELAALTRELERATRALTEANVSVYPVDAAGLVADAIPAAEFGGDFGPGGGGEFRSAKEGPLRARRDRRTQSDMRILAESTGGRAYYDTNDLSEAISQAVADTRFVYTLGFRPDHDRWDGSFHEIKVKTRREGVRLQHRRGYFALPERQESKRERDAALAEAGRSPLAATGIGLQAQLQRDPQDAQVLTVILTIDARDLSLTTEGDRRTGSVDVLLLQTASPGARPTYVRHAIELDLRPETYEAALKGGVRHTMSLKLSTAAERVGIVVRDAGSGAVGSLTLPAAEILAHGRPAAPAQTP